MMILKQRHYTKLYTYIWSSCQSLGKN